LCAIVKAYTTGSVAAWPTPFEICPGIFHACTTPAACAYQAIGKRIGRDAYIGSAAAATTGFKRGRGAVGAAVKTTGTSRRANVRIISVGSGAAYIYLVSNTRRYG
jgi:hypothetical protein